MTKLNQILAIEPGVRNQTSRIETDLYHALDKKPLFQGLSRTYTPKDEDGDRLPPESTPVQIKSGDVITELTGALTRLIDLTATKDTTNTVAKGDIVVEGQTFATDVPVPTLLFLEKELEKLAAFIKRLPILDPAQTWNYDPNRGHYVAEPVQTVRTKKTPKNWVKAEATQQHPAQVEVFFEDLIVGTWEKIDFSGALPADEVGKIGLRLEKLRTAVKFAREAANATEVADVTMGAGLLNYLFEGGTPQTAG